jgi:hypothetical protein
MPSSNSHWEIKLIHCLQSVLKFWLLLVASNRVTSILETSPFTDWIPRCSSESVSNLQLHCECLMMCTVNTVAKNFCVNSGNNLQIHEFFRGTGSNPGSKTTNRRKLVTTVVHNLYDKDREGRLNFVKLYFRGFLGGGIDPTLFFFSCES